MNLGGLLHQGISPQQHDLLDVAMKMVAAVALIPSALYAIWQYVQAQKGPFRAQQMQRYIEACEATAVLSNEWLDTEVWRDAERKFWVLYWGPMAVVEDVAVSTAMIAFGEALLKNSDQATLRKGSLDLSLACRSSISLSWQLRLGKPAERMAPQFSPKGSYTHR